MRSYKIKLGTISAMLLISGISLAGVADDFKNASNRDGCDAIPYSSDRDTCNAANGELRDWCKNSSKPFSCDDFDPTGINRNIERVNNKINDLKKEKDDLEYKRNNAKDDTERRDLESKIQGDKDEIETLQKKIEAWTKQIASEKSMARDRQVIGETCLAKRESVQQIFASVKSKVQNESDPDAKQYASKLVDIYNAGEESHREPITRTKAAIERCKAVQ